MGGGHYTSCVKLSADPNAANASTCTKEEEAAMGGSDEGKGVGEGTAPRKEPAEQWYCFDDERAIAIRPDQVSRILLIARSINNMVC
jgi:hypothetical protein